MKKKQKSLFANTKVGYKRWLKIKPEISKMYDAVLDAPYKEQLAALAKAKLFERNQVHAFCAMLYLDTREYNSWENCMLVHPEDVFIQRLIKKLK